MWVSNLWVQLDDNMTGTLTISMVVGSLIANDKTTTKGGRWKKRERQVATSTFNK